MLVPKIDLIPDLEGCVYKLFWGEVYVIVKAKTFIRSKTIIESSLERFLEKNKRDLMYHRFFSYIKDHPHMNFRVKILLKSDNPYRLLIKEQEELDKCHSDLNCFNNSFVAYVPKGIQGKRKAWINRGHYLNFMIWRKKHQPHGT
jgi:hypothetical protein